METYNHLIPSLRLSAGQALVRFLASQHSERDGCRERVVPAMFGIFGHGNVCGVGQALEQDEGRTMRYLQPKNEQAMVHAAIGYARARQRLSTLACSASIGPGSTNMLTGAAAATVNRVPVLLLPSDTFATRLQGAPMQALDDPARGGGAGGGRGGATPSQAPARRGRRRLRLLGRRPRAATPRGGPRHPGG